MKKGKLIVLCIFLLTLLLGGVNQFWHFFNQPFQSKAFVELASRHGLLIKPTDSIKEFADQKGILVNQPQSASTHYTPKLYVIDVEKALSLWWFPTNYKLFLESELFSAGVTFACERETYIDGSIIRRDPRSVGSRMSGIPISSLKQLPGKSTEWLFMIFVHESVHLLELHIPPARKARMNELFSKANATFSQELFAEAATQYQSIYEECPAYYPAIDHHARAMRRLGRNSEVVDLYKRSLEVKPDNEIAIQNIIPILIETRRTEEALKHSTDLETMFPENPEGFFWEGVILLRGNNAESAMEKLARARDKYISKGNHNFVQADMLLMGYWLLNDNLAGANDIYKTLQLNCKQHVKQRDSFAANLCNLPTKELAIASVKTYKSYMSIFEK
ncbi:hypothetical protein [Neptunicella sp. SCSIO 80796]|uniref:hypothetical protein n=1 Tax=Neptunicella plasticusilytica TaxID=3117012 RepID=UPI003A4D3A2E